MAVPGRLAVIMGVQIDEAGRDDLAFGVDLLLATPLGFGLDRDDAVTRNHDIGFIGFAAVTVDVTGNYRLIWLFPAVTGLAHAAVNTRLKYPAKRSTSPDMVKRLWEWSIVQAESMAETGIVTGLLTAPLLGVVTEEDADSAVVIDMARNILGNPYADDDESDDDVAGELTAGADEPAGSVPDQEPEDGSRLVTGVDQVGGGPVGEGENGDQKLGLGDESSSSGSAGSSDMTGSSDTTPEEGTTGSGLGSEG